MPYVWKLRQVVWGWLYSKFFIRHKSIVVYQCRVFSYNSVYIYNLYLSAFFSNIWHVNIQHLRIYFLQILGYHTNLNWRHKKMTLEILSLFLMFLTNFFCDQLFERVLSKQKSSCLMKWSIQKMYFKALSSSKNINVQYRTLCDSKRPKCIQQTHDIRHLVSSRIQWIYYIRRVAYAILCDLSLFFAENLPCCRSLAIYLSFKEKASFCLALIIVYKLELQFVSWFRQTVL